MIKKNKSKNSQRGAALVEMALLSSLIAVVAIQSIGQLGNRTADRMCDNAAKVNNSDTNRDSLKFFYDKEQAKCCTQAPNSGRFANASGSQCE